MSAFHPLFVFFFCSSSSPPPVFLFFHAPMVPQPTPWTGPADPRLVDPALALESDIPVPPLPFLRNTSGRPWKSAHGATVRSQAPKVASGSAWTKRLVVRKKDAAFKKLEKSVDFFAPSRSTGGELIFGLLLQGYEGRKGD